METFLTPDEILQLVNTGMVELTQDLILRMVPKYQNLMRILIGTMIPIAQCLGIIIR